jgi:exonuclease I
MPFRLRPEGIKWPQFSSGQLTEIAKYFDAEVGLATTAKVVATRDGWIDDG